jgi:hypothetical protein
LSPDDFGEQFDLVLRMAVWIPGIGYQLLDIDEFGVGAKNSGIGHAHTPSVNDLL